MNVSGRTGPRLGCFGYGCAIAVVLMVATFGGMGYYVIKSIRTAVTVYTVENPPKLEVPPTDPAMAATARSKLEVVALAVRDNTATVQELTGEEIRAFIQSTSWRDFVVVSLDQNRVHFDFSFPLTALGEWTSARFLLGNLTERGVYGSADGSFSITNGIFKVSFSTLTLNGKVLEDMARGHASEWVSGALNSWGAEAAKEDRASIVAPNVSVEIRDGKAIVSVVPQK